MSGKCEGCGGDKEWRTSSKLCLKCRELRDKAVLEKKAEVSKAREAIFLRDEYKCVYCGHSSIEHGVILHVDHVYPRSKGGKNDLFNLVTSCQGCNLKKVNTILPDKIILRIWSKNRQLNLNLKSDFSYNDLISVFDEHFYMYGDKQKV